MSAGKFWVCKCGHNNSETDVFCARCHEEGDFPLPLQSTPTYTASQVQEMKNAWVDEEISRVQKLTCFCNTFKQMMIDSGHADVSLPDYQCQRCEVLATIKEMKE